MPRKAEEFTANDRIRHALFGAGTIRRVDERYMTIAFDTHGTKKFITSLVQLERSDTPAPEKPVRAKSAKKAKA
ncbi:MAG TPA: hypothetical protein VJS92_10325 [Candidatus Polarisedimenticolaceae bacterium]|nr:hypothetical protein [Candidatus Polarisedimenticolaceae bacterium]